MASLNRSACSHGTAGLRLRVGLARGIAGALRVTAVSIKLGGGLCAGAAKA